jgi:hypothetical protein
MSTCPERETQWISNFRDSRREASLNWLALGLLLAAWNASDNDPAPQARPRPESLRAYPQVSVRAAARLGHSER